MRRVIGVLRAREYSPGAMERDEAIMRAVVGPLHGQLIREEDVTQATDLSDSIVFSMARRMETLQLLSQWERKGVRVINPSAGVMNCRKSVFERIMSEHHLPVPPQVGRYGYWLKRGDMAVSANGGIRYCKDEEALEAAKKEFAERGITDVVVQAHVRGDVVKFYGVLSWERGSDGAMERRNEGTRERGSEDSFFRSYLADGMLYDNKALQAVAEKIAQLVGIQVYGGDAVVTPDGDFYIIDFNDWPSFSPCREEAAEEISSALSIAQR